VAEGGEPARRRLHVVGSSNASAGNAVLPRGGARRGVDVARENHAVDVPPAQAVEHPEPFRVRDGRPIGRADPQPQLDGPQPRRELLPRFGHVLNSTELRNNMHL
jgi:hypothetical protein